MRLETRLTQLPSSVPVRWPLENSVRSFREADAGFGSRHRASKTVMGFGEAWFQKLISASKTREKLLESDDRFLKLIDSFSKPGDSFSTPR